MTARKRIGLGVVVLAVAGAAAVARPGDRPADEPAPVNIPVASPFPAEPPPRMDPSVSLDWSGPPAVRTNRPAEYTLTVRNLSAQPAQKCVVQVRAPKDVTVHQTAPAAKVVDGVYLWELGTLDPRAATHLRLTLSTAARGEMGCQAWVTFTGTAGMKVAVQEPKLKVTLSAPETAVLGETVKVTYTVKNEGDAPAEAVWHGSGENRFREDCPFCPKSAPATADSDTKRVAFLNPGEERTETVGWTARTPGPVTLTAGAGGSDLGLSTASATVRVLEPKLTATITGPDRVLVGRKATYTVIVRNAGEVPVTVNKVVRNLPAGWQPVPGTMWDALTSADVAPILGVGQKTEYTMDVVPGVVGAGTVSVEAVGSRGTVASADKVTAVDGIAALRMELVDLQDPVEKGGETTYEVRVTNTGTKADTNVVVACPLPEHLKLVTASGPVGYTAQHLGTCTLVRFEPVRELAPKTDAVFRVTVKAVAAGDVRFKAQLTSTHLSTSVVKEESTRVYGD